MLYPLSYEGGAGAIGGRKPGAGPLRIGRSVVLERAIAAVARARACGEWAALGRAFG